MVFQVSQSRGNDHIPVRYDLIVKWMKEFFRDVRDETCCIAPFLDEPLNFLGGGGCSQNNRCQIIAISHPTASSDKMRLPPRGLEYRGEDLSQVNRPRP